tara:strand:- start:131 stop:715 length:585 start_codon:yes stop_codon:yes gene_type:complete
MGMKVLVGCEYSGRVREAFRSKGHDAWSCDVIDSDDNSPHHLTEDVLNVIHWQNWDLAIFFPPCTHLASSGARWFKDKVQEQAEALDFIRALMDADIPRIAIENPIGVISSQIRKPDQIVQPYWFGDRARKSTCLWLQNLPLLEATNMVEPELITYANGKTFSADYGVGFNTKHGHRRSVTYQGLADAMAEQWG